MQYNYIMTQGPELEIDELLIFSNSSSLPLKTLINVLALSTWQPVLTSIYFSPVYCLVCRNLRHQEGTQQTS